MFLLVHTLHCSVIAFFLAVVAFLPTARVLNSTQYSYFSLMPCRNSSLAWGYCRQFTCQCKCLARPLLFCIPLRSMPLFGLERVGFTGFPYAPDMIFHGERLLGLVWNVRVCVVPVPPVASPSLVHPARWLICGEGRRHVFIWFLKNVFHELWWTNCTFFPICLLCFLNPTVCFCISLSSL